MPGANNKSKGGKGGGGSLEQNEIQALRDYTGAESKLLNNALSGRSDPNDDDFPPVVTLSPQQIAQKIEILDNALRKLPAFRGTVTRGINVDIGAPNSPTAQNFESFMRQFVPGKTISFPTYTSTSAQGGESFKGNIQFTIRAKGKQGRDISRLSKNPSEREVVFGRNTPFVVKSVTPTIMKVGKDKTDRIVGYKIELEE